METTNMAKVSNKIRDGILRDLSVIGWEKISLFVMTSFLSGGTPALLGFHGSGKTMGFTRIARSLGLSYQLYDCSKLTEEILTGMYDIEQIKQGK